jgi:hypothetical protein
VSKMKIDLRIYVLILLLGIPCAISAQTILTNVTYICSGEHIYFEYCDKSEADSARCAIAHPDKLYNGGVTYSYETKGNLRKLLPTCVQPTAEEIAREAAFQKRVKDQQDAAQKKNLDGMASAKSFAPPPPTQLEREQAEIRECIEAGRQPTTCMGETMSKSLQGMMAEVNPAMAKTMANEHPPGLYLTGVYKGGNFTANFGQDGVSVSCRDLVPDGHSYTIQMNGNRAVVNIQAQPQPFSLTFRPDGTLVGPATVDLKGNIVVGHSTQWKINSSNNVPYAESTPILRPTTQRCEIGGLQGSTSGPQTTVTMTMDLLDPGSAKVIPSGLRVNGQYLGMGGFAIKFHTDAAVVHCGAASVAHDYRMVQQDNQLLLELKDAAHPIVLVYRSDGTLAGAGPIQVNGRKIVGEKENGDLIFAPQSAACTMGVLSAKSVH